VKVLLRGWNESGSLRLPLQRWINPWQARVVACEKTAAASFRAFTFFFVAPTHLRHFAAGFISHWLHLVSVNTVMVDPQDTADTAAIHPVQVENRP
jgi:hypothetical protein